MIKRKELEEINETIYHSFNDFYKRIRFRIKWSEKCYVCGRQTNRWMIDGNDLCDLHFFKILEDNIESNLKARFIKIKPLICVCGHDLNFHDVLSKNACHEMTCKCEGWKQK